MYVNIMIAACRVEVGYGKNIWANIGRNIVPAAAVKGGAISEGMYTLSHMFTQFCLFMM